MSTNTLETAYANGQIIDASHVNELTLALLGAFVGRNSSGVPTTGQSLGTLAIPWGNVYADGLILDGTALDTSLIVSSPNRVVSGKTRSLSSMPDFIRANGAALSFQVLGDTTDLVLSINNMATSVITDITKTGVTAAPSSNNTCLVNDTTMTNDKYAGEDDTSIIIDTAGTEITAKVGQICAFKNGSTDEILMGFVKSTTEITDVYRGFFFDSSGNPLVRENLSNNDTLTLMSLGWVFVEDNGTTIDITYKTPVMAYTSPTSPATGDYWYDLSNQVWKRYSGVTFEVIDRILIGAVVADATNCIASRCVDFSNTYKNSNNVSLSIFSTEIIRSKTENFASVYGTDIYLHNSKFSWNITTDLETGLTEAASTLYYLYLSDNGQTIISDEKPYDMPTLQGFYHPYHSWRCLGEAYNDASSNIVYTHAFKYNPKLLPPVCYLKDIKASATAGGTATSGSYQTRVLNTKEDTESIVILSANQFTLVSPGTYQIEASAPAQVTNSHKTRIQNITDATTAFIGQNSFAGTGSGHNSSYIVGNVAIKGPKTFELQHRFQTTAATNGLGQATSFGDSEVYSIVKITKLK